MQSLQQRSEREGGCGGSTVQKSTCNCKKKNVLARRDAIRTVAVNGFFLDGDNMSVARRSKKNNQMPQFCFDDVERLRQQMVVTAWFAADHHQQQGLQQRIVIIGGLSLLMGQQMWIDCCAKSLQQRVCSEWFAA